MDDILKIIPIKKMEADIINDKSLSLADKAILLDSIRNSSYNRQYGALSTGDLARGMMQAGIASGVAYAASKMIGKIYSLPNPVANSIINMAGFGGFLRGIGVMGLNKQGMEKQALLKEIANVLTLPISTPGMITAGAVGIALGALLYKLTKSKKNYKDLLIQAKLDKLKDVLSGLPKNEDRAKAALLNMFKEG